MMDMGSFTARADARWIARQTNAALREEADIVQAERLLVEAGLFLHPDRPKRWDETIALIHADNLLATNDPVLDAGGEYYSTFLPNLRRLGRRHLTAINTVFREDHILGGVRYRPGDVTRSGLPAGNFAFIVCLSVIEHGVPVAAFLAEQARLLKPGGHLFISCDYWDEGVDVSGRRAYGAPVRVFDRQALNDIVSDAAVVGLTLAGEADWHCQDRLVHWTEMDLRYTFATMLFHA